MRHSVHILIGSDLKMYVARLQQYVLKYGEGGVQDFFKAYTWEREDSGEICIKKAELDKNGNSSFVSTTQDLYATKLVDDSEIEAENTSMHIRHFFSTLHQTTVTIKNRGESNSLLLVLYVPLYDAGCSQQVVDIVNAIKEGQAHYSIMVVGLCSDLRKVLCTAKDKKISPEEEERLNALEKESLDRFGNLKLDQNSLEQVIVMQNMNAEGFALNLDTDSLLRIFGEMALLTVEKYHAVFSQATSFDRDHPIFSLGLSVLNLDKYYFANYLLRLSYLRVMEREDVCADAVDVNKVAIIANQHLQEHHRLFTNFYDNHILPLVRSGMSQDTIMSQASVKLKEIMQQVMEHLLDYISDDALTLPEKKALLAMILGYDDPLLHGNLFNQDQLTIDSLDEDATRIFIDANNALVQKITNEDGTITYVGGVLKEFLNEEGKVELPLSKLQQLRNSIRESTNYIRQKTKELEDIGQMQQDSIESQKLLTEEGFVIGGKLVRFDADHNEVEFDEYYTPKNVTESSIDLRDGFTTVKHQGKIGACTVFSVASIFEYILKKNSHKNFDLSESFVYYNVRHAKGLENEDTGSSFHDVIQSIGSEGICLEELHPYSSGLSEQPSDDAYADAKTRRIVKALNVAVNEDCIKSAIQEGYPVAVSLKVFNSFNSSKGFVPHPSAEEKESGEFGYHAMVICGYTDESHHFVVRNSWGEDFGDGGYCYIPYSYVCDTDLNRMCCIVTEVDTSADDVGTVVKGLGTEKKIVQFNLSDASIKAHIIENLLKEEEQHIQSMQEEDRVLRKSYEMLMQTLGRQTVRNEILSKTKERLSKKITDARKKQNEINTSERPSTLSVYDKKTWKTRIGLIAGLLFLLLIWGICCAVYMDSDNEGIKESFDGLLRWLQNSWSVALIGIFGILAIITTLYWWYIRSERRKMEMELEDRSSQQAYIAKVAQSELDEAKLKYHIAGMVIDELLSLKTSLDKKYQSMKSYISNLAVWYQEEKNAVETMEPLVKEPFIPLLNNKFLDSYFAHHTEEVIGRMRLYEYLKGYQLDENAIIEYKKNLKYNILQNVNRLLDNFSIFRHIFNKVNYDYIDKVYASASNLLPELDSKSVPFCQIHSSVHIVPQARFLFLKTDAEEKRAWMNTYPQYFISTPISEDIVSVYKIIELRLQPIMVDDVMIESDNYTK